MMGAKLLLLAGLLLAAVGIISLTRGLSYGSDRDVLRVGDVQVSATAQRSVPPWAGWVAILAGVAMVGVGAGQWRVRSPR